MSTDVGDVLARGDLLDAEATPSVRITATYPPANRGGVLPEQIEITWDGPDYPAATELVEVIGALAWVTHAGTDHIRPGTPPVYGEAFGSTTVAAVGREGA